MKRPTIERDLAMPDMRWHQEWRNAEVDRQLAQERRDAEAKAPPQPTVAGPSGTKPKKEARKLQQIVSASAKLCLLTKTLLHFRNHGFLILGMRVFLVLSHMHLCI